MYSRYHGDAEREIRVPENYGGSVFADAPRDTTWTAPPRSLEVAKPSPPSPEPPRPSVGDPVAKDAPRAAEPESVATAVVPKDEIRPRFLNRLRLFESFGFEELLLLGLILLLSESGADTETLLWLGLLLLAG